MKKIMRETVALDILDEDKGTQPRRRASGLSRERIVDETLTYLRAHPNEQLTIARAAAAAGAAPMSLYRHFTDGADLAGAIVSKVLEGLGDEIPKDGDWRQQARAWMEAVYHRIVATPQSVALLRDADELPVAWVRATTVLRRILVAGGFEGEALHEAHFWITMSVSGFAQQTLSRGLAAYIEGTLAAIGRLEPDEIAELADVAREVPHIYTRSFDIMLERILASAEMLRAQDRPSSDPAGGETRRPATPPS